MKKALLIIALVAAGLMLINGCASMGTDQGPGWVWRGSGAFEEESGKVFYGVGAASGIKNEKLLRVTANNRAHAEVLKVVEIFATALTKDCLSAIPDDDTPSSLEATREERTFGTFSHTIYKGVEIVDYWKDPEDGTMYALSKLDLEVIKRFLDDFEEIDEKRRDYLRSNADRIHDELARMENN